MLCVIGIIGILIGLLMPSLITARQSAMRLKCLATLRQLGVAFHAYAAEQRGYLPYPTTLLYPQPNDQRFLWFNAIDPYLAARSPQQVNREGIAATRNYKPYKQCYVWETFEGDRQEGFQSNTKELARTYKMNAHLRRPNPQSHANLSSVPNPSNFVLLGDGVSLDLTGSIGDLWESGQFSMEVNDTTQASPGLRHRKGANILFVDGHASACEFKRIGKSLREPEQYVSVATWESEYLDATGQPVAATADTAIEVQGLHRNSNMPLQWSDPPRLHRP